MTADQCNSIFCYIQLKSSAPKFFGFSEFLAALALMVLAWTIADVRYRFRVRTAPLPLQGITFVVVGGVGFLSLVTDWWRAEQWRVPEGNLVTPAGWQALLGGLLLVTFMTWVWFAFMRPAVFSRWNGVRFARQLFQVILRGSPTESPEVADELAKSAKNLILYSWTMSEYEQRFFPANSPELRSSEKVKQYAYDLLGMIADRRFCKYVVQSSPATALALFEEMAKRKKYGVPLGTFARNITSEAIANKDSFVYQEVAGYYTGLLGSLKPLTNALYGNYELVSTLERVFDVDYRERQHWDATQWEAYCRLVLMTFKSYVKNWIRSEHSFVIFRAVHEIQGSVDGLYNLSGVGSDWGTHESLKKLDVVVNFALEAVKILDSSKSLVHPPLNGKKSANRSTVYDLIAELMLNVILNASSVKEPRDICWWVQNNAVWDKFFGVAGGTGPAGKIIRFKLRRLFYNEIDRMTDFPNFQGSRLLGMILNTMGLKEHKNTHLKSAAALHRAVLNWTKKHYAKMASESPRVANSCLLDGFKYESSGPRLTLTGDKILDREQSITVLDLDPLAPKS